MVNMKGYCFLILAVAFLMYFQKEPVFTVIIFTIAVGLYFFIKARKSGKGFLGFMGGNEQPQHDKVNDLMTLMLLQQLFSDKENSEHKPSFQPSSNESDHDKMKQEIMALFDIYGQDFPQKQQRPHQKKR